MTKSALTTLAVTSALVLGGMAGANAVPITETYDFTASAFVPSGSPISTWDGSFTITFDPAAGGNIGPFALDAFSSNLPASYGTFVYSQQPVSKITIGDNCGAGGCTVNGGSDQAFLFFSTNASGVPSSIAAAISGTSTGSVFETLSPTVTLVTPATPLPATLPLFATGLGALGLLGWFGKRKARVSLLGAA